MLTSALRRAGILVALAAALVLIAIQGSENSTASHSPGNPQFNPTGDTRLCNGLDPAFPVIGGLGGACTTRSAAAGANPDLTTNFFIPAGHMNFAADVFATTLSPDFDIAPGSTHALGTAIGGIRSTATLGLTNNACNNTVFPDFVWWNATVSTATIHTVAPEGTANRFASLANVGATVTPTSVNIAPSDANVVTEYPDISLKIFDPDGSGDSSGGFDPVIPHARYASLSRVPAGGEWQLLQLFVFKPGELAAAFAANPDNRTHPFARLSADLGWTTVTVLNDPTAVQVSPNPITDFCSTLETTAALLGAPGGVPRLTAPPAGTGLSGTGTHLAQAYALSQRDADLDGLENGLDTCPFTPNTEDPYTTSGPDADMLDSACDPTPAVNTNFGDHDNDVFLNAQDNCPIVSNPGADQKDSGLAQPYTTAAPDGGPKGDGIGDACDTNVNVATGTFFFGFVTGAVCIDAADSNNDGFCDGGPSGPTAIITDGDGFRNDREVFMNTDPLGSCSLTTGASGHRAWPPDIDNNRTVNILDLSLLTPPVFGSSFGDPNYFKRRDLDASGAINILDLSLLTPPTFGSSCFDWQNQAFVSVTGGTVVVKAPATATVVPGAGSVTVTFASQPKCRPEVAAAIWAGAGDTVDTASAACSVGNTASVAPPAFGPTDAKFARAAGTSGTQTLTCTFQWTDAGAVNTRAAFWCRG